MMILVQKRADERETKRKKKLLQQCEIDVDVDAIFFLLPNMYCDMHDWHKHMFDVIASIHTILISRSETRQNDDNKIIENNFRDNVVYGHDHSNSNRNRKMTANISHNIDTHFDVCFVIIIAAET